MTARLYKPVRGKVSRETGFTFLEILIVVAISSVIAAIAIPGYLSMMRYLRIAGDSRDINATIALAKMRAAENFTHARVNANLLTDKYSLEVWDKSANGGAGCWKTEGDAVNRCTATASPTTGLSPGVSFGFGSVTAASPNPQTSIAQAPVCTTGVAGGVNGTTLGGTSCIEFNSRGLPVAQNGLPTANDALYVTDLNTVYGVTVIVSGLIQIWSTDASSTTWQPR